MLIVILLANAQQISPLKKYTMTLKCDKGSPVYWEKVTAILHKASNPPADAPNTTINFGLLPNSIRFH